MDNAELGKRLETIDQALTAIHIWQSQRPSAAEIALRLEEVLATYGLTAQLVEIWRNQLPEIRGMHRDLNKLIKRIADLEQAIQSVQKAIAVGEERG